MIYDNYFLVPDGAMCRPFYEYHPKKWGFQEKSYWLGDNGSDVETRYCLGKWETQERSITITESEFDDAFYEAYGKQSLTPKDICENIKKELFKCLTQN